MSKYPYISKDEMEHITQSILSDYGFKYDTQVPESIPIDEIIEFHYELDILWEKIDHFDESGLVMAAIIPSQRQIIMNESCKGIFKDKIGTMHFTMAHELGHWVLHVDDKQNSQISLELDNAQPFYCRSKSKKPPEEFQADMFAASLLMPKQMILKVITALKSEGKVQMKHLYELRDIFQVSISALTVRLHELDLLYIHNGIIYDSRSEYGGQMSLF